MKEQTQKEKGFQLLRIDIYLERCGIPQVYTQNHGFLELPTASQGTEVKTSGIRSVSDTLAE